MHRQADVSLDSTTAGATPAQAALAAKRVGALRGVLLCVGFGVLVAAQHKCVVVKVSISAECSEHVLRRAFEQTSAPKREQTIPTEEELGRWHVERQVPPCVPGCMQRLHHRTSTTGVRMYPCPVRNVTRCATWYSMASKHKTFPHEKTMIKSGKK